MIHRNTLILLLRVYVFIVPFYVDCQKISTAVSFVVLSNLVVILPASEVLPVCQVILTSWSRRNQMERVSLHFAQLSIPLNIALFLHQIK